MTRKIVIITGASRGIGLAIARQFLEEGHRIVAISDNVDELKGNFRDQSPENTLLIPGDLADLEFVLTIVPKTLDHYGSVDTLINNAAWRAIEPLSVMDIEHWERTIRVCLTVPAILSRQVAHHFQEQKKKGVIINISSIMAKRPSGTAAAYTAAKGGLLSLTYEMAALYGPSGIRCVSVSPGNISTALSQDFTDREGRDITGQLVAHVENLTPLGRSGEPQEIAHAVVWLASENASFVNGTNLVIDGGFSTNFNDYYFKKLQFPDLF